MEPGGHLENAFIFRKSTPSEMGSFLGHMEELRAQNNKGLEFLKLKIKDHSIAKNILAPIAIEQLNRKIQDLKPGETLLELGMKGEIKLIGQNEYPNQAKDVVLRDPEGEERLFRYLPSNLDQTAKDFYINAIKAAANTNIDAQIPDPDKWIQKIQEGKGVYIPISIDSEQNMHVLAKEQDLQRSLAQEFSLMSNDKLILLAQKMRKEYATPHISDESSQAIEELREKSNKARQIAAQSRLKTQHKLESSEFNTRNEIALNIQEAIGNILTQREVREAIEVLQVGEGDAGFSITLKPGKGGKLKYVEIAQGDQVFAYRQITKKELSVLKQKIVLDAPLSTNLEKDIETQEYGWIPVNPNDHSTMQQDDLNFPAKMEELLEKIPESALGGIYPQLNTPEHVKQAMDDHQRENDIDQNIAARKVVAGNIAQALGDKLAKMEVSKDKQTVLDIEIGGERFVFTLAPSKADNVQKYVEVYHDDKLFGKYHFYNPAQMSPVNRTKLKDVLGSRFGSDKARFDEIWPQLGENPKPGKHLWVLLGENIDGDLGYLPGRPSLETSLADLMGDLSPDDIAILAKRFATPELVTAEMLKSSVSAKPIVVKDDLLKGDNEPKSLKEKLQPRKGTSGYTLAGVNKDGSPKENGDIMAVIKLSDGSEVDILYDAASKAQDVRFNKLLINLYKEALIKDPNANLAEIAQAAQGEWRNNYPTSEVAGALAIVRLGTPDKQGNRRYQIYQNGDARVHMMDPKDPSSCTQLTTDRTNPARVNQLRHAINANNALAELYSHTGTLKSGHVMSITCDGANGKIPENKFGERLGRALEENPSEPAQALVKRVHADNLTRLKGKKAKRVDDTTAIVIVN